MEAVKQRSNITLVLVVLGLALVSVLVAYLTAYVTPLASPMVIALVSVIAVCGLLIKNYRFGYYLIFLLGIVMFLVNRMFGAAIPLGVVYDGLVAITFFALFLNPKRNPIDWTNFKNPVTYFLLAVVVFQVLQVFNPSAVSFTAWLVSLRMHTNFLIYIICFHLVQSMDDIKKFTKFWLAMAMVIALYGFKQEYLGLSGFEWRWIYESPERFGLYYIWGHLRKFSILSDPAAFGQFMAFASLTAIVLALGPFKTGKRLLLGGAALFLLVAISFSGTRTAFAMVAAGIVFYILLTIRSRRTMLIGASAVFLFLFLLFGPIYSGPIIRLRSTFKPSDDQSMEVRDIKRLRWQPYIRSHPIGGGVNTIGLNGAKYSQGHPLAGGWYPDSGYLGMGLELGWVGMLLFLSFYFYVCYKGIDNYYSLDDPLKRTFTLAYVVPFFALSVAHFTQEAMYEKSISLVVISAFTIIQSIPTLDNKTKTNALN